LNEIVFLTNKIHIMKKHSDSKFSRRNFIGTTAAAFAGFSIIPSHAVAGLGHIPPSDKLNIAGIGIGGKGNTNLRNMPGQNIVALCDVDWMKTFSGWKDEIMFQKILV